MGRPFAKSNGCSETYYRKKGSSIEYFSPDEVETELDSKGRIIGAKLKEDQRSVIVGPIEKMSKSKNNGVDPEGLIKDYGADTVRLYTMFAAPPEQMLEWSDTAVEGSFKFLKNLWKFTHLHIQNRSIVGKPSSRCLDDRQSELKRKVHQTIKKVTDDYDRRYKFNTAIAAIMELYNLVSRFEIKQEEDSRLVEEGISAMIRLLHPIAPHITEALWCELGNESMIDEAWPEYESSALISDMVEIVIQINGKKRSSFKAPLDLSIKECENNAKADKGIVKYIQGKNIKKIIVVPNKLVNIVI